MRATITGLGSALPQHIVRNDDLANTLDTSDEWIRTRTGITQRHIAAQGEYTSHLAARAAAAALQNAGIAPEQIDLLILATATPDESFPASATRVQQQLGITGAAFDVNAACSGFVYGVHIADAMLASGHYKYALVIGAETMSRVVDWEDRRTAILFGDGAGAAVLSATDTTERGILASMIDSDGAYADLLGTDGGVSRSKTAGVLHMEGKEVFRHAVAKMSDAVAHVVKRAGLSLEDVDYLVPHQANARILQSVGKKLSLSDERVLMSVDQHANTSSASIPLALAQHHASHGFISGDVIVLTALGAGFTWGGCVLRW